MDEYINKDWQEDLQNNALSSFEDFWKIDEKWFESPNYRRGGWSGVTRSHLMMGDGTKKAVFIKRQKNHFRKNIKNSFKGNLTFSIEFEAIMSFREIGIPTLEPVYYGLKKENDDHLAVLVTNGLDEYFPLDELIEIWQQQGWPDIKTRKNIAQSIAHLTSKMHEHKFQHNCFYPKHLFVKVADEVDTRVIDLEKVKKKRMRNSAMMRDLDTLNRHITNCSLTDRMRFLLAYLDTNTLTDDVKKLWYSLEKKSAKKTKE